MHTLVSFSKNLVHTKEKQICWWETFICWPWEQCFACFSDARGKAIKWTLSLANSVKLLCNLFKLIQIQPMKLNPEIHCGIDVVKSICSASAASLKWEANRRLQICCSNVIVKQLHLYKAANSLTFIHYFSIYGVTCKICFYILRIIWFGVI